MQRTSRLRSLLPTASRFSFSFFRHVTASPRLRVALSLFLIIAPLLSGCIRAKRTPNLERVFRDAREQTGKRPLIVIPGILGSQLV
ncbi:MAG TPA: hypothetical protein VKB86_02540, partial [Pyrinomonadaceae bacterium]|nr:hypothetical protein [Pyrinomonadaceae bacterium]